jgi:hypothetical protein
MGTSSFRHAKRWKTCVSHRPVRTPSIRTQWISDTNPSSSPAELVALANNKRFARPVGNILDGHPAIAEKDAVVIATELVRHPR